MALRISKGQLVALVGGMVLEPSGDVYAEGVVHDSREIRGGELFIALKGEQANGAQYVNGAYERGAALAIVASDSIDVVREDIRPYVVAVEDPLAAYWRLAQWWRQEVGIPLIAVTGSVGKTTVKELLAALLVTTGQGHYSRGSYNNHTGVPYTLCQLSRQHTWGVIEIGMSAPGEVDALVRLVQPQVALITCIAPAHLGFFNSIDEIADAKLEIIAGLPDDGTLILNADDDLLCRRFQSKGYAGRVLYFGKKNKADVVLRSVANLALEGIEVDLAIRGEGVKIRLPLPGVHNGMNLVASFAAALELRPELNIEAVSRSLRRFVTPVMRMEVVSTRIGKIVVNDAYNANPKSMEALLDIAADLAGAGKRVGLILGDMLELGEASVDLHAELGRKAAALGAQLVVYVGEFGEAFRSGFSSPEVVHLCSKDEVAQVLSGSELDVVLLKASRGIGLEQVADRLIESYGGEIAPQREDGSPEVAE